MPCPKCGALIVLNAIQCPECGVHFRGHAVDFSPTTVDKRLTVRPVMRRIALAILIVFGALIVIGLVALISNSG